jgi:outer membrane protein W
MVAMLGASIALVPLTAGAQEKLDGGLKIEPARRHFMRFGYTYIKPSTKPAGLKDQTGAVISYNELKQMADGTLYAPGSTSGIYLDAGNTNTGAVNPASPNSPPKLTKTAPTSTARGVLTSLYNGMTADYKAMGYDVNNMPDSAGLGVPAGVEQVATGAGTPTISAGLFLDEDYKWAVEAYIFAIPFRNKIKGAGRIGGDTAAYPGLSYTMYNGEDRVIGQATDLGVVATTQQLPLTAIGHYYFGEKSDKFRVSLGLAVSYAIFFNSQASQSLETYSGGPTTIKIKNAFGAGPYFGAHYALGDNWFLSASLGYLKLKTTATVTTRVDPYAMGASVANYQSALDLGSAATSMQSTVGGIAIGDTPVGGSGPSALTGTALNQATSYYGAGTTAAQATLVNLARARAAANGTDPSTLGTYVRKVSPVLDPYVLTVAIGYAF